MRVDEGSVKVSFVTTVIMAGEVEFKVENLGTYTCIYCSYERFSNVSLCNVYFKDSRKRFQSNLSKLLTSSL